MRSRALVGTRAAMKSGHAGECKLINSCCRFIILLLLSTKRYNVKHGMPMVPLEDWSGSYTKLTLHALIALLSSVGSLISKETICYHCSIPLHKYCIVFGSEPPGSAGMYRTEAVLSSNTKQVTMYILEKLYLQLLWTYTSFSMAGCWRHAGVSVVTNTDQTARSEILDKIKRCFTFSSLLANFRIRTIHHF